MMTTLATLTDGAGVTVDTLEVPAAAVAVLVSVVVPTLTGLLTKATARPWVKNTVAGALVALGAVLTDGLNPSGGLDLTWSTLGTFGVLWIGQLGVYMGLVRPSQLTDTLAPRFGLGSRSSSTPATPAADPVDVAHERPIDTPEAVQHVPRDTADGFAPPVDV